MSSIGSRSVSKHGTIGKCLLLSLLAPGLLDTASADPAPDANGLEEVVVDAKHLEEDLPRDLARYGTRVDTISAAEIRNGGYLDVASALQAAAPGLYIQQKNGPFDYVDISLLGSRTEDVLWLVDGVRINNRLYASTTPLDTMPASIVDRLEVIEGGQALFYGTQAIAGAVNIVTKDFSDTPDGSVTIGGDTNGGRHLDAYFRDGSGRDHFVVYGSEDQSDGYHAFRAEDYQPSDTDRDRGYDVLTIGGKYALDITDGLRISASYQHTDADLDDASPFRIESEKNDREEQLGTVKLDYNITSNIGVFVKGYYHYWYTHYTQFDNDLMHPGVIDAVYPDDTWGYRDYGVNGLAKLEFDDYLEYYVGYDLQIYGGHDDVLVIRQNHEDTNAVFGQIRSTEALIPDLKLAAGFRYNAPSVGETATVWNFSGEYDFGNDLFLRGSVGTNFRLPTAEELFADDPDDERGNPNLKPETSTSLNLSVGGALPPGSGPLRWEAIGFLRNISNLIDYVTFDAATDQDVFGNLPGTVRVRGGELSLQIPVTTGLLAGFSYTYSSSKDSDTHQQIPRVPEHLLKAGLDYEPEDRQFGAELALNFTGDVFTTVGADRIDYGNYAVVNLSGHYFLDEARHHRLNLSVENLFDAQYGRPGQGCADVPTDGPFDCSAPYTYVNLGQPRTLLATYTYKF